MEAPQQQPGHSYVSKIEILLQIDRSQEKYADERCLVALVLLTNPNLIPASQFQAVWISHQEQLLAFCTRLISANGDNSGITVTYARLVVILLGRLLSLQENTNSDDDLLASTTELMKVTSRCASDLPKHDEPQAIQFTSETIEALSLYCSLFRTAGLHTQVDDILGRFLIPLWHCYVKGMVATLQDKPKDSDDKPSDEKLMENTLQAIVQRSAGGNNSDEADAQQTSERQKVRLHTAMEAFYRNEVLSVVAQPAKKTTTILPAISEWLTQCLLSNGKSNSETTQQPSSDYSFKRLPKEFQQSWQETLLLSVTGLASHPDLPNILAQLSNSVIRLILLHVVSPERSGLLRLLAWTTCAAWVDRLQGFDWILVNTKGNKKTLGSASHLCALIRLASGEWRIQLGYRLAEPSATASTQERAGMVQGCAQVLASLVAYLGQIADDMGSKIGRTKRTLSPEALLHLRDSLEDTFQATSNYLSQLASVSESSIDKEDAVVMQLLGSLLSEFDVFDGLTNLDTDEILNALCFSMRNGTGFDTQELVITGLMGVLESARGDSYRVLLLREHGLIGDSMASFLHSYWTGCLAEGRSVRSIPAACHLTELWFFILTEHKCELHLSVDTSTIEHDITAWMRRAMGAHSTKGVDGEFLQALNASVACFVTLHGDTPPSDEDGRILQGALQFCSMHS